MALVKSKITCIGSALIDIMYTMKKCTLLDDATSKGPSRLVAFEFGAKYHSDDVQHFLGGGALNTAATFYNLGLKPTVVASVGNDAEGRDIRQRLKRLRIIDRLQFSKLHGTGLSFIVNCNKRIDHVVFTHSGARSDLQISTSDAQKIRTPWIYLSGLSGGHWQRNLERIYRQASSQSLKVAWNPGAEQIDANWNQIKKFFASTEVLLLNFSEATTVVKRSGITKVPTQPRELIRELHRLGQTVSVVTNGAAGAYVYDGKKLLFKSALKKKNVANTTGAGDAFGAGFVAGLQLFKGNLSRSLSLAIFNSGHVVQKNGAQAGILTKQQVNKLNI